MCMKIWNIVTLSGVHICNKSQNMMTSNLVRFYVVGRSMDPKQNSHQIYCIILQTVSPCSIHFQTRDWATQIGIDSDFHVIIICTTTNCMLILWRDRLTKLNLPESGIVYLVQDRTCDVGHWRDVVLFL